MPVVLCSHVVKFDVPPQKGKHEWKFSEDEEEEDNDDSDGDDMMKVGIDNSKIKIPGGVLFFNHGEMLCFSNLKSAEDIIAQQSKQDDDPFANLSKKEKKKKKKLVIIVNCYETEL